MIASLALALLAALLQLPQQGGAIHGHVRSESTGAALAGAVVEVLDVRPARGVSADARGAYRLRDVPAGRHRIRVRHLGYAPLELEVVIPAGRDVELDVSLRVSPIVLEPVRVRGRGTPGAADTAAAPAADLGLASARAMESTPGLAEMGLAEVARGVPGQEPVDPADVLYVRGTGADLKLVYLDGAPVYAPFPLGGLLDAFTPGLLHRTDIYLGGAPARYDGGLSYILDLRTRGARAERAHFTGAADMLAARALAEVPFGSRSGVLLAGRTVHDLGTGALTGTPLPYGYREGIVRGDLALSDAAALSVTAFGNGEQVWLDGTGASNRAIDWGNTATSARLRSTFAGTDLEVTAALGDFRARLPFGRQQPRVAEGTSTRMRLSTDLVRPGHALTVRYGAAFDRQRQRYRARIGAGEWEAVGPETTADELGAYVDLGWQVEPRVRLRGGLRVDHFSLGSEIRLAPRLAATWLFTERAALTLAAGRYHQYLRPPESLLFADDSTATAASVQPLALGRSSHVALTLDQELGDGVRLGIEGFYKSYENVPGGSSSEANASGVDVWVRRGVGRWTGWVGYSLAWTWSVAEDSAADRFAGRHLLSSGLSAPLGEQGRLDVGFAYGAGLPYSAIPFAAVHPLSTDTGLQHSPPEERQLTGAAGAPPLLPSPTRPYLRLDVAASRTWTRRLSGTPMQFTPYVKLLNTLGDRDALFYRYDSARDDAPRPLLVLPLVPVLGVEWTF